MEDERIDRFIESILEDAKSVSYNANLHSESTQEEIQEELVKIYSQGGLMSFPLRTDYLNNRDEILKDKKHCEKIDNKESGPVIIGIVVFSLIMAVEFVKLLDAILDVIL